MVMDRTAIDVQTTPLRLHGEPTSTWTGAFCQYVSRNVREYFAEWQPTDARAEKEYRRKQVPNASTSKVHQHFAAFYVAGSRCTD
eukprot:410622-Pleurochrysis_carterae.AAC.7